NNLFQGGMYIYGSVGVGTASPGQKFSVVGAAGDTAVVSIVTTSGNTCTFSTTTGLFSCASDERLKHDISGIEGMSAVSQISKLNPVMFHYNWQDDSEPLVAGFVAQELEEIFPEMVFTDKDGYKSLSYSALMPYTIKAIQELELKINTLQTLGGDNNTGISGFASAFFSDVLEKVENGVGYVKGMASDNIKVGSKEKRTGVTLYNETGKPYCVSVANGIIKTTPGECSVIGPELTILPRTEN
ncbi:MAG: tail fiber domain-containing protein, partial [Patescibacteria group bacterium]